MKNLELLLPFSLPPAELRNDLIKAIQAPALANLLAASTTVQSKAADGFSSALPHEYWLAGYPAPANPANSPAISLHKMRTYNLSADDGYWFLLQPVHIHIARDHLVLTDQRRLDLSDQESRELFDIARTVATESGFSLVYGDAQHWFLRADSWSGLRTATPDAACGHNIDIWMPKGQEARAWRKFQNEIQMLWFTHDINQQRESIGKKSVNSVWLSGGSDSKANSFKVVQKKERFSQLSATSDQTACVLADILIESALNNDWGTWLQEIIRLEENWFAPLYSALRQRQLKQVTLICSDHRQLLGYRLSPWSLYQFWRRPHLQKLFPSVQP
ncbi:hypothetical protein [Undibacterium oligocarboniphilum]|uniref:Cofactor-independent phosphoglycerate mutase n=1 Tax=Undibacterium oligocarboniphilum TaxID=666702 RepID=A0A850QH02_9BURK|nr:hypothetical protein [Undibacterium oligocarboniphilum]MBC3868673.1 hypothetical protein [Undibacterium oligocarboniphilum]NVO76653.1 hypothetical protein [Undibacterium oligocarboniphilum]